MDRTYLLSATAGSYQSPACYVSECSQFLMAHCTYCRSLIGLRYLAVLFRSGNRAEYFA